MLIPLVDVEHPLELVPLRGPSKLPPTTSQPPPTTSAPSDVEDDSDAGEDGDDCESDTEHSGDSADPLEEAEVLVRASAHAARDAAVQELSGSTRPGVDGEFSLLDSQSIASPDDLPCLISRSPDLSSPTSESMISSSTTSMPAARVIVRSILVQVELSLRRILDMRASQQSTTRVH